MASGRRARNSGSPAATSYEHGTTAVEDAVAIAIFSPVRGKYSPR